VLGHLMPMLGKDWSHSGITQLYTNIKSNGYHLLYLTSRAIGQSNYTKGYLEGLKQADSTTLPKGPVFTSPDRLFQSFNREVIRRQPHEFKIACLKDILSVFPEGSHPFYAGFGNRDTDALAYRTVGVPNGKIFTINPTGDIRLLDKISYRKTYRVLNDMVHEMFPPLEKIHVHEDWNDWNFWKTPEPTLEDLEDLN